MMRKQHDSVPVLVGLVLLGVAVIATVVNTAMVRSERAQGQQATSALDTAQEQAERVVDAVSEAD